jgi:hypothetical protein
MSVDASELLDEIRDLDPELAEASEEVDPTLVSWSLALSPRERLRAAIRAGRALDRFRRFPPR